MIASPKNGITHEKGTFDFQTKRIKRLLPFYVIAVAGFVVLLFNLAMEQLIRAEAYIEREQQQTLRQILLPGPRGNIFDRNGELLVGNRARFSASVYLNELRARFRENYIRNVRELRAREERTGERVQISNNDLIWESRLEVVQGLLDEINRILDREETITRRSLERHFSQRILLPLPLVPNLSEEDYALLIDQLPPDSPILIRTESARYYPHGSTAAHLLGYVVNQEIVSSQMDLPLLTFSHRGITGKAGVELSLDDRLSGASGSEVWRVDPMGFQYERVSLNRPEIGDDVQLSIQLAAQQAAEEGLRGKKGAVVALDPLTGEILALASAPDYDLNDLTPFIPSNVYRRIEEEGGWLNRAVQGLYPPGSTFKPMTALAAFERGVLEEDEVITSGRFYRVGNRNFPEHSRRAFGDIDLVDALAVSSNVFFYQVGLRVGVDAIAETSRQFGMDRRTGVELPFEASRMIVPTRSWKRETVGEPWFPGDTANLSIGQGFLRTTPLHMALFAAGLAMDGTGLTPTILLKDNEDPVPSLEPFPLSLAQRESIREGMVQSVERGTARRAQIPDVTVAGKTGTAQIFPDGRALTLAWFIGYAPVEEPRIAIAVVVEGVTEEDQFAGGSTAAPIARNVMEAYLDNMR